MVIEKIKQLHKHSRAVLIDLLIDYLLKLERGQLNYSDPEKTINIDKDEEIIKTAANICDEIDLKILQKLFSRLESLISEALEQKITYN